MDGRKEYYQKSRNNSRGKHRCCYFCKNKIREFIPPGRLLFREEIIPPGGDYSSLRITPHPIFSPESPAGWVVKSSLWEWMMTDFPMISSMVKRLS